MEFGQTVQVFHNHVDAVLLRAVAEFSAAIIQVFQYDQAVRAAIIIPIGVIAFGRWHLHFLHHEMIKAGLQRVDIDIVERARPIGFHAQVRRQSGGKAHIIPVHLDPPFGRVAVEQFNRFHALGDDAGIFVPHHPA